MKNILTFTIAIFVFFTTLSQPLELSSPDGRIKLTFLTEGGVPAYAVSRDNKPLLEPSRLGFKIKNQEGLNDKLSVVQSRRTTKDETWEQPWGEVKRVRNRYNALVITLEQKSFKRKLLIEFRAFNDGVAFRYSFPKQPGLESFVISDEVTEFNFANNFSSWWIPAYGNEMDSEWLYNNTPLNAINQKTSTPVTLEGEGVTIALHEAALVDFAGMALEPKGGNKLKCDLVPWSNGDKALVTAPFNTPWRTIQITDTPLQLAASNMILNLNEPNKIGDISWIKPGKYIGIWWGMHLTQTTWEAGPRHGATTENVKAYIDFASRHKLSGVLAEGWNKGWEGDWTASGNFNFTTPYPDSDIAEAARYAKEKGVSLIAHHETGENIRNYEEQLEDAFKLLQQHDIHYLKTGYVNKLPSGERHQGQFMVRHYHKVMEMAAKYRVMLDVHEPVKDTGLRRTYPNMMTREGARGTEYEAWSSGNPPSHTTILPFTRCVAGPLDYTPGIFDIRFKNNSDFRVHTTLAKQLALYVVIYSPLHMAADLPVNYEGHPGFKFIEDVATDWDESHYLNGRIGEYVTVARKARGKNEWFIGSLTNEHGRELDVKLDFLPKGRRYTVEIYCDGAGADMESNPLALDISSREVEAGSTLRLNLAPGGGTAISIKETTKP